jgi:hypothetical protein
VHNVPCKPNQVQVVAERIAPVSHSFLYGTVFDVVAEHNPVRSNLYTYIVRRTRMRQRPYVGCFMKCHMIEDM